MKRLNALWLGSWLSCAPGCAGHAIDLDSSAPPAGSGASAGVAPEITQLHSPVQDFWADDARVYWTLPPPGSASPTYGCVFSQCATTLVTYATQSLAPSDWMLPLGDDIFFNPGESMVVRCPKTGCVGAPTQVLRDIGSWSIDSDGTYLYWQSLIDIYRCPVADCGDIPELVARRVRAEDLHVQGSHVFWTTRDDPNAWLLSAPVDGSELPSVIVSHDASGAPPAVEDAGQSYGFTLDSQRVYWIDTDSQVRACSLSGCQLGEPTIVPTDADWKGGLVADASGLYFFGAYQVVRYCPSAGCATGSAPKAISTPGTQQFRLTPSYVYWGAGQATNSSGESDRAAQWLIYRTPKPNQ